MTTINTMHDLHGFRGNYDSFAANKDDIIIAGAFGDVRGMRSIDARRLSRTELSDLLRYDADAVVWYELATEDMEPLDPC